MSVTPQYLLRETIDDERWDALIERAGMPYAYSWYLDIVTSRHWNALVAPDYSVLMPLPFNRKLFGVAQIYQPILCQQLGVFGATNQLDAFFNAIPEHYKKVVLPCRNQAPGLEGFRTRTNLVLPLNSSIAELKANYGKSLRKRLRKAAATQTIHFPASSQGLQELVPIYQQELNERLGWSDKKYERVKMLLQAALDRGKGVIAQIEEAGGITAIGFFLRGHDRLVNLFGASTERGRETYAMHLLLDGMIDYAKEQQLDYFDFEGSEIPGVAEFFRSFGAREELYYQYERNSFPAFINWGLERR